MYYERRARGMEIGKVTLERHLQELRWVMQELMCVLPSTVHNKALCSSLDECIERLNFAIHNLDRNTKKLTKKKEKENKDVQQKA